MKIINDLINDIDLSICIKKLIILITFVGSLLSFAIPSFAFLTNSNSLVGSEAVLTTLSIEDKVEHKGQVIYKISEYDVITDSLKVETIVRLSDLTLEQFKWVAMESFIRFQNEIQKVMADCESLGGVRELILVPAGTFSTCRVFSEGNNTTWYSLVPFGVVRRKVQNSTFDFDEQLQSFL